MRRLTAQVNLANLTVMFMVVTIGVAIGMGIWNHCDTNDAVDAVTGSVDANTEVSRQIATYTGGTFLKTGEIVVEMRRLVNSLVRIADAVEGGQSPLTPAGDSTDRDLGSGDLGNCQVGFVLRAGERCHTSGPGPFEVHPDGAYSPWDWTNGTPSSVKVDTIKVDPPDSTPLVTFQARLVATETWQVLATGPWRNLGSCKRHLLVQAGQYCVEERSGAPFRVYATDELNPGETRSFYRNGYAVLFWFPNGEIPHPDNERLHDQQVRSGDHFLAEAAGDGLWRIVRAD